MYVPSLVRRDLANRRKSQGTLAGCAKVDRFLPSYSHKPWKKAAWFYANLEHLQ